MGRWGDGEMGRWGDGEMGRWGDGENCKRSNGQDACSTKLIAATRKNTFDTTCRFFDPLILTQCRPLSRKPNSLPLLAAKRKPDNSTRERWASPAHPVVSGASDKPGMGFAVVERRMGDFWLGKSFFFSILFCS
ncbi:hypothetical protein [Moorena producens]|uniref:hypothetical protein n=1 Tax=Moorena producens TaxID=1155739 RepID=UPI0011EA60E0|nr:hypothetical protein [Moorena producens]